MFVMFTDICCSKCLSGECRSSVFSENIREVNYVQLFNRNKNSRQIRNDYPVPSIIPQNKELVIYIFIKQIYTNYEEI